MGTREDDLIKSSATVMPVHQNRIGFLRRDMDDSYPGVLLAPGGSLETVDGEDVEGVRYHSAEAAACRELREKCGIQVNPSGLRYLCSMTLPIRRLVISFYCNISYTQIARSLGYLEFYGVGEVFERDDFAPGMKEEALRLFELLARAK